MFAVFSGIMQTALTFCFTVTGKLGFPNYGLAIILLTVAIKLLLYPLTAAQVRSMRAMQALGPQMKALQEKHRDDKEKLQQEVAGLYRTAGVNPMAGCLPMLIQLPFLTGIFYAIQDFSYASQPSFLWIGNLAGSDPSFVLPVLAAVTTYVSSRQTMTDTSAQNKAMLFGMPLFIGYMTLHFPAGLGLYWVVGNVIQIVQQLVLYRRPAAA